MNVREAVPADAEAVRAVHSDSITGLGREAYSQEQIEAWAPGCEAADYTEAINEDELLFVVAEMDSDVVAFGSLKLTSPDEYEADVDAEITGVYVHPSVARQGVGTRIYTELEEAARTRGEERLGLPATRNAVPFYESHGFERVRAFSHEFSSHESTGVTGTIIEMKKTL